MLSADDADFTDLVSASSRRLLRTAYLITGDAQTAQDLLQTALERAYRRWGRIRRSEIPEAYVRRVIVNAAIDARRSGRWARTVGLDEARLPAVPVRSEPAPGQLPVAEPELAGRHFSRSAAPSRRCCSRRAPARRH